MLYFISGKLAAQKDNFAVVDSRGLGFKIFIVPKARLPKIGSRIKLFCYTNIKQDGIDFYGFLSEKELGVFELLNTVKGVGPRIALKILSNGQGAEKLLTLISQKRADVLAKTSGINKKTAERIVLELMGKINPPKFSSKISADAKNNDNTDLEKILSNLGFKKNEVDKAIKKLPLKIKKIEDKIRIALKILAK